MKKIVIIILFIIELLLVVIFFTPAHFDFRRSCHLYALYSDNPNPHNYALLSTELEKNRDFINLFYLILGILIISNGVLCISIGKNLFTKNKKTK